MKKEAKDKPGKPNITYLLIALMSLLLIFSLVQSYQISAISSKMSGDEIKTFTPTQTSPQITRSAPKTAPTMVGGC